MNFADNIVSFFKKPAKETKGHAPDGVCSNCWGQQEYDNKIRDMYDDKQINVNNYKANHAFIQDFVVNQLSGIRLVKGNNSFECPTCRVIKPENN
jgi:hypothetical protein